MSSHAKDNISCLEIAYFAANSLHLKYSSVARTTREAACGCICACQFCTSADERYRELIITLAQSLIMPAHVASLDAVFVEPKFLSPLPLPQSASEIESIPIGPRTLPLHQILTGHPQLIILGAPGTGRTTLLAYIALVCARAADEDEKGGKSGEERTKVRVSLGSVQERLPLYVLLPAMNWVQLNYS